MTGEVVKKKRGRPKGSKSMKPHKQGKMTIQKKHKILEIMKKNGGNQAAAAAKVGVSPATIQYHMKIDPVFEKKVYMAKLEAMNMVEEEITRRAIEGVEEDVYYKGEVVGKKKNYSDTLLLERARALDPQRYGRKSQVNVDANVTVETRARSKLASILGIEIEDAEYEEVSNEEAGA